MINYNKKLMEYGWLQLHSDCKKLAKQIIKSQSKIQSIYGVPRGGLVPAVILSHLLGLKLLMRSDQINSYTLVVDDISDTGKTLNKFRNRLYLKTATLWISRDTKHKPMFYCRVIKKGVWIKFPFETDKSTGI